MLCIKRLSGFLLKKKKKKKHTSSFRQSCTGRGGYRVITVSLSRHKIHNSRFTFAVHGSRFRVQGSGFDVRRSAFNVQRSAFSVHDTRYTIHDSGIAEADRCSWRSTKFFLRKIKRCKSVQK